LRRTSGRPLRVAKPLSSARGDFTPAMGRGPSLAESVTSGSDRRMADYSRSISIKPFTLQAGDLVRLLEVVRTRAIGDDPELLKASVSFDEHLPDGTRVSHPPGGMSLILNVCRIDDGTEVIVSWRRKDSEKRLYVAINGYRSIGITIHVSAPTPGMLNDAIDVFKEVFVTDDDDEENTVVSKRSKPPTDGVELEKVHVDGRYKTKAAWIAVVGVVGAALITAATGIYIWKLNHP